MGALYRTRYQQGDIPPLPSSHLLHVVRDLRVHNAVAKVFQQALDISHEPRHHRRPPHIQIRVSASQVVLIVRQVEEHDACELVEEQRGKGAHELVAHVEEGDLQQHVGKQILVKGCRASRGRLGGAGLAARKHLAQFRHGMHLPRVGVPWHDGQAGDDGIHNLARPRVSSRTMHLMRRD
jgi:hypothetical protein